jgi:4-hydroxy-2-oxoheptanedioate aldolase
MKNTLLDKLKNGEKTIGTFFSVGNAALAECLALSGIDYILVDTEHGPFDIESTADIIRSAEVHGTPVLARVKDSRRPSILKMLDIGAKGLIIPDVHSLDEVKRIVEFGKYYPKGLRGMATARSAGFGFADYALDLGNYLKIANEQTLILPQCETRACLNQIEEITALEGVGGIFLGPFDLSVALGKPMQFNDPEFVEAVERIVGSCKRNKKYCFTFSLNAEGAKRFFDQGFDSVVVGNDSAVYIQAYKTLISQIRG